MTNYSTALRKPENREVKLVASGYGQSLIGNPRKEKVSKIQHKGGNLARLPGR